MCEICFSLDQKDCLLSTLSGLIFEKMRGLCGGKSVCNNWMSLPAATGVLMAGSISASIVHSDIQNITPLFPSE